VRAKTRRSTINTAPWRIQDYGFQETLAMTTQEKHEVAVKSGKTAEKLPTRTGRRFDDFESFLDQMIPRGWLPAMRWPRLFAPDLEAIAGGVPKVDVIDRENEILVKAEMPGVKKEDIRVSLVGNVITIKGETKREEKEEKGDYYRCEISRGEFSRMLTLPADVDETKAKAELRDGVLEISLPKTEATKKRDIKVE
jgi:HSP20 family protein